MGPRVDENAIDGRSTAPQAAASAVQHKTLDGFAAIRIWSLFSRHPLVGRKTFEPLCRWRGDAPNGKSKAFLTAEVKMKSGNVASDLRLADTCIA